MANKFLVTLRPLYLVLLLSIITVDLRLFKSSQKHGDGTSSFTNPEYYCLSKNDGTFAGQGDDRPCPHSGLNFRGRCFWFMDVRTTWYEAGHLCHRLYGDHVTLVTIKDRETNDFIRSQSQRAFWIGLHEAHGETNWRWVDNTEPANGNYQNWEGGATPPARSGNRNCGIIKYDSDLWADYDCGTRAFFVCAELPSPPMCPHGGIFFRDRCYWRGNRQLSWRDANQACQDDFGPDARLAVARDAETNLFLSRLAGRNIWLGLSDITEEGVWKWIDGAPFEYRNWASPQQPDNWHGVEDCGEIRYPSAQWNDVSCGDPYPGSSAVKWTLSYICAVPPCYETTDESDDELVTASNEEVQIIDHSICARTECTERCVNGGACNAAGQCVCVQQFSRMTCNLDEWKVEMENELINTTTGSTLTLKCKVNLPVDHISSLTWTKCEPGFLPQYRHTITKYFSQGYSMLQVSDLLLEDAGVYHCKVVLSFGDNTTIPVVTSALVDVTEASTPVPTTKSTTDKITTAETRTSRPISLINPASERTATTETSSQVTTTNPNTEKTSTKETQSSGTAIKQRTPTKEFEEASISSSERTADSPTKENKRTKNALVHNTGGYGQASSDASKNSAHKPAGGHTALIVILLIMTTLLLVAVVVLMIKMRRMRMEIDSSGDGKLIELEDKF